MADQVAEEALAPEPVTLEEGLGWVGWKLDGYSGSSVGRVEGVLADAEGGQPAWLVVRMGRFGHFSAVPFALAAAGANGTAEKCPKRPMRTTSHAGCPPSASARTPSTRPTLEPL